MPNIRLIILNYKRPENVLNIATTYKTMMPVTVVNNNPDDPFPYLGNGIDVINNEKNYNIGCDLSIQYYRNQRCRF